MDKISSSSRKRKSGSSPRRKSGSPRRKSGSPRRKSGSPRRKSGSPKRHNDNLSKLLSMIGPDPLSYLNEIDLVNLSRVNKEIPKYLDPKFSKRNNLSKLFSMKGPNPLSYLDEKETKNLRLVSKEFATNLNLNKKLLNLRTLNLLNKNIGDKGAIEIANSPYLKNLTKLDLSGNNIGPEGAIAIANSPYLKINELNLSDNHIGDIGCSAIGMSTKLVLNLEKLILSNNNIGYAGVKSFNSGNFGGDSEMAALLRDADFKFKPLIHLDLCFNNIGNEGAISLAKSKRLKIQYLNLGTNNIGDKGAIALSQNLQFLQELILWENNIGDEGGRAFANMRQTRYLKELDLLANHIGLETVIELIRSRGLTSSTFFKSLTVAGNNFDESDEETIQAIQEAISNSTIDYISWEM